MADWVDVQPDEELYEEAVSGDRKCAELLFSRHKTRLYNLAYRLVRDPQLAQDFVQETFLNILSTRRASLIEGQFKAWAYAATLNLCRTHIRKARKLTEPQKEPEAAPPSESEASAEKPLNKLVQAIAELPERQQEAIILSKYEKLSYEEIGHLLGCSTGAIKALIFRGMELLRSRIGEKS